MSRNGIPPINYMQAKAIEKLSGAVAARPGLVRLLLQSDAPSHIVVPWQMADQHVNTIPQESWAVFSGNPRSGRLSGGYSETGLVSVDAASFRRAEATYPGRQALAYPIGRAAVMVGVLPEDHQLAEDDAYPDKLLFGGNIGQGTLRITAGKFDNDYGFLSVASDVRVIAERRFVSSDFPAHIPVL